MKPKDDLFLLVQSMSKSEKRYFKVRAKQHERQGSNNYVLLFDALDKSPEYDEDSLRRQLKKHTFVKNLSTTKYQLYNLILQYLYDFRAGKSVQIRLSEMIQHIAILYERGLFRQAEKLLAKAKDIAAREELFAQMMDLLALERRLMENSAAPNIIEALLAISEQEKSIHRKLENLNDYSVLRARLSALRKQSIDARTKEADAELQAIQQHPLLENELRALSRQARFSYFRIKAEAELTGGPVNNAADTYAQLLDLWKEWQPASSGDTQKYHADLVNYLNACLRAHRFEAIEPALQQLRSIEFGAIDDEIKSYQDVVYIQLLYCLQLGLFGKGKVLVAEFEQKLQEFGSKFTSTRVLAISYNICLLYFFNAEYHQALHWIQKVVNSRNTDLRQDLHEQGRLLLAVLHYELGNIDILDSLLRAAQRHLKQRTKSQRFEVLLVSRLYKIINTLPGRQRREQFSSLREELHHLQLQARENVPLGLTEIMYWVESKTERIPLKQVLQEKIACESTAP